MDFNYIKHTDLTRAYKSGLNWFYWIAGLTMITSLFTFGGGGFRFLISLGSTQVIDGFATGLAQELGSAAKVVALVFDLIITGIFVLFGFLASKKMLWAYVLGMVVFGMDGLVNLLFGDFIGVLAHGFALFFLVRGFLAGRELVSLEQEMAQAAAPQPEPAL